MCGIVGYTGNTKAPEILFEELKILEYRGYDSAGLAIKNLGKTVVIKKKGRVEKLKNYIANLNGNIGIGHTRWATHGKPTDKNSHPHSYGKITLVHNGIIENYKELKNELLKSGHVFTSQTDSEVIAHTLNDIYNKSNKDMISSLRTISTLLVGTFALAIISEDDNENIYLICRDSSLVIGKGEQENFIASDARAFIKYTDKAIFMRNEELAIVSKKAITLYDKNNNKIIPKIKVIENSYKDLQKGGHNHFMHKEIFESPIAMCQTINAILNDDAEQKKIKSIFDDCKKIILVGCGTAYHACLIGKYLFQTFLHKNVTAELASEFCYDNPIINEHTVVIAVSQSGETADTIEAVIYAKKLNARTLCICNNANSRITLKSDAVILTKAGSELGVAATKTYLTQILIFYILTFLLKNDTVSQKLIEQLKDIPNIIEEMLLQESAVRKTAKKLYKSKVILYLGKNLDLTVAEEASLKLKEISYIFSDAYAAGELKHGTLALIDKKTTVIAIITQNNVKEKTLNALHEIKSRGGKIAILTQFEDLNFESDFLIKLPKQDDVLMPLVAIIPLQLFAYYVSVCKNCDPDKPRHLAKSVTVR